jgi:hypothetical protein
MKKTNLLRFIRIATVLAVSLGLASCEDPQVYGSVGVSSYGGGYGYYGGGPRIGTSISIGGRIR